MPAISIHAPREGCDPMTPVTRWPSRYFNPRTPRGVRRGDGLAEPGGHGDFNPRTPRGVRRAAGGGKVMDIEFQSTHPARGATGAHRFSLIPVFVISIHAPREGCDAAI